MTTTLRNLIATMLLIGASQGAMASTFLLTGNSLPVNCGNEERNDG